MSNDERNAGILLHRFLKEIWTREDTTRHAWSRKADIPDTTIFRWSEGIEPTLPVLRKVAAACNMSLLRLLVEIKLLDETDADLRALRREVETERKQNARRKISIEEAIKLDQDISDSERRALSDLHGAFQAVKRNRRRSVAALDSEL